MNDNEAAKTTATVGLFEGIGMAPSVFAETLAKHDAALESWYQADRERIKQKLQAELVCSQ